MTDALLVLVSCASARQAGRIARALVAERLAACVSMHRGAVRSVYRWKGKVEHAVEVMLLIKTEQRLFGGVERRVRELHSYEVPEIIALPVAASSAGYLQWLKQSVGKAH